MCMNVKDIAKFKAISKYGKFVSGYHVVQHGKHYIVDNSGNSTEVNEDTLCLFTGYKDINGVDLYTDDIIEYTSTRSDRKMIAWIDFNSGVIAVSDVDYTPVYDFFHSPSVKNIHFIGNVNIGDSMRVMDEYENDYYESCAEDPIDVDICIDKISKAWNNFQCIISCHDINNPEPITADDLDTDEYSKSLFSCAKNLHIEKYTPEIDTHILSSKIAESFDIYDFCNSSYTPFHEQIDYIIKHESDIIDKIFLDEFRANGYDTPEKIRILFDTHFWKLGDMLKNIKHIISEYHKSGVLNYLIYGYDFCAPTEPVKMSDEVVERIKERMKFLYGTDAE